MGIYASFLSHKAFLLLRRSFANDPIIISMQRKWITIEDEEKRRRNRGDNSHKECLSMICRFVHGWQLLVSIHSSINCHLMHSRLLAYLLSLSFPLHFRFESDFIFNTYVYWSSTCTLVCHTRLFEYFLSLSILSINSMNDWIDR